MFGLCVARGLIDLPKFKPNSHSRSQKTSSPLFFRSTSGLPEPEKQCLFIISPVHPSPKKISDKRVGEMVVSTTRGNKLPGGTKV